MEKGSQSSTFSIGYSLGTAMLGLIVAIYITNRYVPEQRFVLGLLTGLAAGLILVSMAKAWHDYKEKLG